MTVSITPVTLPDTGRIYTANDLLGFPADWRYELIEGHLDPMSPAGDFHGAQTNRLASRISVYVYDNDLGECWTAETGFLIARNPDTILAPDFAFVLRERMNFTRTTKFVPIVPDLVLETRSPRDREADATQKAKIWLNSGVQIVLDLDPTRQRLILYRADSAPITLGPDDPLEGFGVVPGFSLPLALVFR